MDSKRSVLATFTIFIVIIACAEDPVKVTTGTIEGVVYDFSTGDVVESANIVTTPPSGSVTSDTLTGTFIILHVEPGVYRVLADKIGYDTTGVNISVIADDVTIADIALRADSTVVDTTQNP